MEIIIPAEYQEYAHKQNSPLRVSFHDYDLFNDDLRTCGANIRLGPPLRDDGTVDGKNIDGSCGIYARKPLKTCSLEPSRSLDDTIKEWHKRWLSIQESDNQAYRRD